jgi:hypothetical protein
MTSIYITVFGYLHTPGPRSLNAALLLIQHRCQIQHSENCPTLFPVMTAALGSTAATGTSDKKMPPLPPKKKKKEDAPEP